MITLIDITRNILLICCNDMFILLVGENALENGGKFLNESLIPANIDVNNYANNDNDDNESDNIYNDNNGAKNDNVSVGLLPVGHPDVGHISPSDIIARHTLPLPVRSQPVVLHL